MGQEQYFKSVQEADQFLRDMVLEIFRYSNVSSPYVEVPIFICFDFIMTEGLKIIQSALIMSETSLYSESQIYSTVVQEYLRSLRSTLGSPIPDNEVQSPYFRDHFAWRNMTIEMLEGITLRGLSSQGELAYLPGGTGPDGFKPDLGRGDD